MRSTKIEKTFAVLVYGHVHIIWSGTFTESHFFIALVYFTLHKYIAGERHAIVTRHASRERQRSLLERHLTRDACFTRVESTV